MDPISTERNELLIEQAVENELPISFRYWSDQALKEIAGGSAPPPRRVVSPYELKDGKNGKTLLVCWSHGSEAIRMFDTARMGAVRSEDGVEDFVHPVERD